MSKPGKPDRLRDTFDIAIAVIAAVIGGVAVALIGLCAYAWHSAMLLRQSFPTWRRGS